MTAKFISSAEKLFEQGIADPRGGEYRDAEIKASGVWGNTGNIKIRCWVMKRETSSGENLCVGWNGLVYPVTAVGEKADLQADVLEMLRKDDEGRMVYQAERSGFSFRRLDMATPHGLSAQHQTLLPIKAVLLWRLNQKELAAKLWNAWKIGTAFAENASNYTDDPYLALSIDWTWALFDRAVTEEMQGNSEIAVRDARRLASVQDKIEAEAARRGFKLPDGFNNEKPRYLSFLAPLTVLLKELERRTGSENKSPSLAEIAAIPNSNEKISRLITKLEDISARQWGQPGGVDLGSDEIVKMLIAQGNSAVEPLLQTIEFDDRLTRSVSFHRNFFRNRHLITVAQAAYVAVAQILKTDAFVSGDTVSMSNLEAADGRKKIVSEIRAYLRKYGNETPEERWYNILLDDNAPAEQWRISAANIIYSYPADDIPPVWIFNATPAQPPDSKVLMMFRGLPLRSKTAPSVSQLFAERVSILSQREDTNSFYTNLSAATNIAMALLIWDSRAGIPVARSMQRVLEQKFNPADRKLDFNRISTLRSLNIALYLKRAEAGDFDALGEYADWMSKINPKDVGENIKLLFEPMWKYPDQPRIKNLASEFFENPHSLWLPLVDNTTESLERANLLETPMINVESFQKLVIKGLLDKAVAGTMRPRKTSAVDGYELLAENIYAKILLGSVNSASGNFQIPDDKEYIDFPLAPFDIRVCDVYAAKLTRLGIPVNFNILWTRQQRDHSIDEMMRFIRNNRVKLDYPYSF